MYDVIFSRQAVKDFEKAKRAGFGKKIKGIVDIVSDDPYQTPPRYEKLVGDLQGYYSRRINEQHRFVYEVLPSTDKEGCSGTVHVLRVWTHYE